MLNGILLMAALTIAGGAGSGDEIEKAVEEAVEEAAQRGDYQRVYELIIPLAEHGDSEAQFAVGTLLLQGYGQTLANSTPEERDSRAWFWIRKAATRGHNRAGKLLGRSYRHGVMGLPMDGVLANCWIDVASGLKDSRVCLELEKSRN